MRVLKVKFENCMYCGESIGFNSEYYLVKKAVKPKGAYKRWQYVGGACESCVEVDNKPFEIEDIR